MSSKDRTKSHSDNAKRIGERDTSGKRSSNKSGDKDKRKDDEDKLISKKDRTVSKSISKIEEKSEQKYDDRNKTNVMKARKPDNEIGDIHRQNIRRDEHKNIGENDEEREERRRLRKLKERENRHNDENNEKRKNKLDPKDEEKVKDEKKLRGERREEEGRRKERLDEDISRNKTKLGKEESNNKHKAEKEESNSRHRVNKEDSSIRHKVEKEESNSRHRGNKEESSNRHKGDKDISSNRHRGDKEDVNIKHKEDKDRDRIKRKEDSREKSSSNKDRARTDARGDKIASANGTKNMVVEYEEDFDEYNDDDFEDADSSSVIVSSDRGAIEESSESSSQQKGKESVIIERVETKLTPKFQEGIHSSFINFRMAQKKCSHDVVANKMLSRAYDLSRLIELDRSHFDILDIAPVLEHSKYMVLFGRAGCQHLGSQTGDDSMGRESQTEVIDERTVSCQHPPLDDEGCVQVIVDTSLNQPMSLLNSDTTKTALQLLSESGVSSAPLLQILELMDRVLEEESSPEVATKISSTASGQQIMSLGYNKYSCDGPLCNLATFASGNSGIFASVHQQSTVKGDDSASTCKSFVSIWRVSSNNREPQRYLSWPSHNKHKSDITSLIFSPDASATHVIGGLDSGLIALWDLREHSLSSDLGSSDPPAYLTGLMGDSNDQIHQGPVIALYTSCTEKSSSSSYQLLSLDSLGNLSIWIVSSLTNTLHWAVASGSLADLNLRPGSRARMSMITTISLFSGVNNTASLITSMTVDPLNPNNIFIGTNNGQIIHHERTTHKSNKERSLSQGRVYGSSASYESATITYLDYYPFFEPYLLAGYEDGSMKVFVIGRCEPLLSLVDKHHAPVIMCRWSKSHPAVLFSLDCDGHLNIWNLLINSYQPVSTQSLPDYIGFDLSSDSRWHLREDKSVNNKARLLIWARGGSIEVHELHQSFVVAELDDCFKVCSFLQSLQ